MVAGIDRDVLTGFVEEARSYLPVIKQGVRDCHSDPGSPEVLETAHRYSHNIKGAASMIGINDLSQGAYFLEQVIEELMLAELTIDDTLVSGIIDLVTHIERYLDALEKAETEPQDWLVIVEELNRRLRRAKDEPDQDFDSFPDEPVLDRDIKPQAPASPHPAKTGGLHNESVSTELLEIFKIEAEDHMRTIGMRLADLDRDHADRDALQDIRRSVHTLKGAAGALGFSSISQLCHRMEDLLDRLYDGELGVEPDLVQLLFESADALEDLTTGADEDQTRRTIRDLYLRFNNVLQDAQDQQVVLDYEAIGDETLLNIGAVEPADTEPETDSMPGRLVTSLSKAHGDVIRVPLERLDELVRLVSELVISRSAFEQRMSEFTGEIDELRRSNDRLQRVSTDLETKYEVSALGGRLSLRDGSAGGSSGGSKNPQDADGFDELQFDRYTEYHILTRELVEVANDVRAIGFELNNMLGDFDGLVTRQARLSTQIQDKLMRTRMVPLATLATRLHRTVRVLAREQGKLVDLVIEGENVEIDTTVLDSIVDPLLHLIRNAVDHGLELPEERRETGRDERGTITLRAFYEGSNVVIELIDDGRGLNREKILAKALAEGIVAEDEVTKFSDDEIHSLVFTPGFTTTTEVSEVSGRGVGLDVVRDNVERLNGVVSVKSRAGEGTTYTIRLPMTLAVIQALIVKANQETFAIPLGAVRQILRLNREEIERLGSEAVVRLNGRVYPLHRMDDLLNLKMPPEESLDYQPVVILQAGTENIALVVDQLLTGREIVIKSLGSHLRKIHGIMGATLMGDGSVVLIINPAELLQEHSVVTTAGGEVRRATRSPVPGTLRVMVVDDSLSVRKVVSNLIESAGWDAVAVKDGIEALEYLQGSERLPDLILVDIEMPRMDGYELMSTLQADARYEQIPLVVLSSRAGQKHREKALEIGASAYLGKPYQDHVMLDTIRQQVRRSVRVESE